MSNDNATRPDTLKANATQLPYSQEEQQKIQMVVGMLNEASALITARSDRTNKNAVKAYNQMQQAILMMLRELSGEAFRDCFYKVCDVVARNQDGIFQPARVSMHLNLVDDEDRDVLIVFLNMLGRFVRCEDKSNFYRINNVERLINRFKNDPELCGILREVFIAN